MNRRDLLKSSMAIPGLACIPLALSSMALGKRPTQDRRAPQDRRTPVIDGMGEIRLEYPMPLIAEVIASGMSAVMITIGTPTLPEKEAYANVLDELAAYENHIDQHRKYFIKATTTADIEEAMKSKKLAILYLFQNTTAIGKNMERLDFFYNFGVRSIQLTYNKRNLVGNGCMERVDGGLSEYGIQLIEAMNEKGIVVDLSHSGMQTMADAIKYAKAPPVISHSGCTSVYDHQRATTDKNIKALADKGGVMGIFQINPNLGPKQRNTLDDFLKHIDYCVKIGGIDCVGIGSDREHQTIPDTAEEIKRLEEEMALVGATSVHWPFFLSELNHGRRMETIRQGLEKRGYTSGQIAKIMGGNFYRVYQAVIG